VFSEVHVWQVLIKLARTLQFGFKALLFGCENLLIFTPDNIMLDFREKSGEDGETLEQSIDLRLKGNTLWQDLKKLDRKGQPCDATANF
jgi:hypothetical protein